MTATARNRTGCLLRVNKRRPWAKATTGSYAKNTGLLAVFPRKHAMRPATLSESCPLRHVLENFGRRPVAAAWLIGIT